VSNFKAWENNQIISSGELKSIFLKIMGDFDEMKKKEPFIRIIKNVFKGGITQYKINALLEEISKFYIEYGKKKPQCNTEHQIFDSNYFKNSEIDCLQRFLDLLIFTKKLSHPSTKVFQCNNDKGGYSIAYEYKNNIYYKLKRFALSGEAKADESEESNKIFTMPELKQNLLESINKNHKNIGKICQIFESVFPETEINQEFLRNIFRKLANFPKNDPTECDENINLYNNIHLIKNPLKRFEAKIKFMKELNEGKITSVFYCYKKVNEIGYN